MPSVPTYYYVEESTDYKCIVTLDLESDTPACSDCPTAAPEPDYGGSSDDGGDGADPTERGVTTEPYKFPFGNYSFKFSVSGDVCAGRTEMLRARAYEGREMNGLITSTGQLIVLPSQLNSIDKSILIEGMQNDLFGRPSIWFGNTVNGDYEVTVYYYNSPSRYQVQFKIIVS